MKLEPRPDIVLLQAIVACAACVLALTGSALAGNTHYVSTSGSDAGSGSIDSPFATFERAIDTVAPGDTIYVRGGTYFCDHRLYISTGGTEDNPIHLFAMPGETPILDFSRNPIPPPDPRDGEVNEANGIQFGEGGDWWHLKGLTIQNAPFYGVRVFGSHNVLEQLVLRRNKAAGLELTGKDGLTPGHNLVLNCDSYLNFDPQVNGEDADGFAAKFETLGPGNVFSGCRAWYNSDDGFDFWHAANPVLVENCWVFENGFNRPEFGVSGGFRGDGMGYKLGQQASRITLNNVVAWHNKGFGIDENGNGDPRGCRINNATVINNNKSGAVQISLNDDRPHAITNSIAFDEEGGGVTQLSAIVGDTFNTWNGIPVTAADFLSMDCSLLLTPRNADGSLPVTDFLRLAPGSNLIDAGTDVGLPYSGLAPDLGAFEYNPPAAARFRRGDCNDDGAVDVSDAVCILNWLFLAGTAPGCLAVTNTNGDGGADLSDAVYLLGYLFLGRSPPVPPFPDCGPGLLAIDEEMGCATPPESCR
jgi:hypothetical protein